MNEVLRIELEETSDSLNLPSRYDWLVCPVCGGDTFVGLKNLPNSGDVSALVCARRQCGHLMKIKDEYETYSPIPTVDVGPDLEGACIRSENTDSLVGQRVRAARRQKGMTQKELAQLMGVSREAVSAIENGRERIPAFRIVAISTLMRLPVSFFFGEAVS